MYASYVCTHTQETDRHTYTHREIYTFTDVKWTRKSGDSKPTLIDWE